MAVEDILQSIGGFHLCDRKGIPHDPAVTPPTNGPELPFKDGMLYMESPHGEFQLKRLAHVTYVDDGRYWVNFSSVPFDAFRSRGCTRAQRRA